MTPIQNLPTEVLTLILRLATSFPEINEATLNPALGPAIYLSARPEELEVNLQTKAAISRVCKQWNIISAPFLCEFISCTSSEHLGSLTMCLEKEDAGYEGKRARWITHLDMRNTQLEHSPYPILLILPSFGGIESFSLAQIKRTNLSDLKQLSTLCPRLGHLAVNVLAEVDEGTSIKDFTVSFPYITSLIVEWVQLTETMRTTFQSWDLPKLHHFGFGLRGIWVDGLVLQILGKAANTLKSLDLCDFGRSTIIVDEDFLPSFPILKTLILDPITVTVPYVSLTNKITPHLTTLGWRITRQSGSHRLSKSDEYFRPPRFPSLKAVYMVYPQDVRKSPSKSLLRDFFSTRSNWIPIWTLNNRLLLYHLTPTATDIQDLVSSP